MSSTKQAESFTVPGVQLQIANDFSSGGAAQAVTDPTGTASALQLSETAAIIPGGSQLGIGIVPASPLHVGVNSSVRFELGSSAGTSAQFSMGGNGNVNVDAPNVVGGRFTVQDNGNVGINQPNPRFILDVGGTIHSSAELLTAGSIVAGGGIVVQGMLPESKAPSGANLQALYMDTNTGIVYYHD
jgi:hypothetical protein